VKSESAALEAADCFSGVGRAADGDAERGSDTLSADAANGKCISVDAPWQCIYCVYTLPNHPLRAE